MPVWSDATVNAAITKTKETIARELKCIVDRISFSVTSGEFIFELPTYTIAVSQITWKGKILDPLQHMEAEYFFKDFKPSGTGAFNPAAFTDAFAIVSQGIPNGIPHSYIYTNLGRQAIMLYPAPTEELSQISGAALWGSGIGSGFIIEIVRLPDNATHNLPSYLNHRMVRYGALSDLFAMEGPGQNLVAAEYYTRKFNKAIQLGKVLISGCHSSIKHTLAPQMPQISLGTVRLPDMVRTNGN